MWKFIKGISKGNKLATHSSKICMDIINFLIRNGYDVRMPDTAAIFKESYSLCLFISMRPNQNPDIFGSMIVQANSILQDWLVKVFKSSYQGYDFVDAVKGVIDSLPGYSDAWISDLTKNNQDKMGQSLDQWVPAAVSHFIINVEHWADIRFGHSPKNFAPTITAIIVDHIRQMQ